MYLSTNAINSANLADQLLENLRGSRQWEVVAQVAVYLRAKTEVRAADDMIKRFLRVAAAEVGARGENISYRVDILSFVNRLLAFVVPRPKTLAQIIAQTLDLVVLLAEDDIVQDSWPLLVSLARARPDNRPGIARSVEDYIEDLLTLPKDANHRRGRTEASPSRVILAVGAILQFPDILLSASASNTAYVSQLVEFWKSIASAVIQTADESIRSWAAGDDQLALRIWHMRIIDLGEFVAMHGRQSLFDIDFFPSQEGMNPDGTMWTSVGYSHRTVLYDLLDDIHERMPARLARELEEWYDVAFSLPPPWFISSPSIMRPIMLHDLEGSRKGIQFNSNSHGCSLRTRLFRSHGC